MAQPLQTKTLSGWSLTRLSVAVRTHGRGRLLKPRRPAHSLSRNLVRRPVFLSWPRVRVDLEAAVKRSADRAGLGLPGGVVVFDSFDEKTTTYSLEDVPGLEVFLRFKDVLRIAGDQRGGLDLVHKSPHKRIIA